MTFPPLLNWDNTRTGLHRAAQVLGAIRAAVVDPEPNWVHLGLDVVPEGLTTGTLTEVGTFTLDFKTQTVLYTPPGKDPVGFSLTRHNQQSLADAIMQTILTFGYDVPLERGKLTHEATFQIAPTHANHYADALYRLAAILKRLRASLAGPTTRVIVWPHGFDLSFLWFATEAATEEAPHMSFGFSPASTGLNRPYIYTYPHPLPDGVTGVALPALARWHTQDWTGTIIAYDALVDMPDPETALEAALSAIHASIAPLLQGLDQ